MKKALLYSDDMSNQKVNSNLKGVRAERGCVHTE